MLVEAFVAQAAVERLDVGVLVRLARLDQAQLHATHMRPGHHRLAAELLSIVAADDLGQTTRLRQAIHHARHAQTGDGPLHLDDHRLVGGVIDDCQALDDTPFGRAVEHEVH